MPLIWRGDCHNHLLRERGQSLHELKTWTAIERKDRGKLATCLVARSTSIFVLHLCARPAATGGAHPAVSLRLSTQWLQWDRYWLKPWGRQYLIGVGPVKYLVPLHLPTVPQQPLLTWIGRGFKGGPGGWDHFGPVHPGVLEGCE